MNILFTPIPGSLVTKARLEPEGLSINGKLHPWDAAPEVVEYGEEGGLLELVSLQSVHTYSLIPSTWVDPKPQTAPDPEVEAAAAIEEWRSVTFVKSWQIIAELGPVYWGAVLAYAERPEADFVTKTLIKHPPDEIPRQSAFVDGLAMMLRLDGPAVDDLFRRAKTRKA